MESDASTAFLQHPQMNSISKYAESQDPPELQASARDLMSRVIPTPEMRVVQQGPAPQMPSIIASSLSGIDRLMSHSMSGSSSPAAGDGNVVHILAS